MTAPDRTSSEPTIGWRAKFSGLTLLALRVISALVLFEHSTVRAFGFPVMLRGEVLSVMEFFSQEIREPDPDLLEMAATLGSQMGQLHERRRLERRVTEQLRDADRRKDEFIAILSHELRNPLAPLKHALELLRGAPHDALW